VPLPKKTTPKGVVFFGRSTGIEKAAPVRRLVQKLRAGEQFLARGKVHGAQAAVSMTVDCAPSFN